MRLVDWPARSTPCETELNLLYPWTTPVDKPTDPLRDRCGGDIASHGTSVWLLLLPQKTLLPTASCLRQFAGPSLCLLLWYWHLCGQQLPLPSDLVITSLPASTNIRTLPSFRRPIMSSHNPITTGASKTSQASIPMPKTVCQS